MQEKTQVNKIIYLDAAATYQKSDAVIQKMADFLHNDYANAGRGVCERAVKVDDMIAQARRDVAKFIGATDRQVVFVNGTTDAMNMIAQMVKQKNVRTVAVSDLDHHSARLPVENIGAKVVVCPLDDKYNIDVENVPNADVLLITAMSNVIGVPQDVRAIISNAKKQNPDVITVVDAAQYVVHNQIDVTEWGCDFLCWSGHKIGADTGVGVMFIKNPDDFNPVEFGGGMVLRVDANSSVWNTAPDKFEAGTLPLTQIIGLPVAIDALKKNRPDHNLIKYMYAELSKIDGVRIITQPDAAMVSFVVDGMHALDFGALVGVRGLCVRVGNMCASWICKKLGIDGCVRISIGGYNTMADAQAAIQIIKDVIK